MNDIKNSQRDIAAGQDLASMLIEARQERDKEHERAEHYLALSLVLGERLTKRDAEARVIPAGLTEEQRKQHLTNIWNAI